MPFKRRRGNDSKLSKRHEKTIKNHSPCVDSCANLSPDVLGFESKCPATKTIFIVN